MSESIDDLPPPHDEDTTFRQLPDIIDALSHLVASAEPAKVFSSLAELCVPIFSDYCIIEIIEDKLGAYRITYPRSLAVDAPRPKPVVLAPDPRGRISGAHTVITRFQATPLVDQPTYAGRVVHRWTTRQPNPIDAAIAGLLINRAIATIHQERLAERAQQARITATNLEIALASSRHIGAAIGILMATEKVTETQAFELLRIASQHTHRKLRDVADEVTQSGCLEPLPHLRRHAVTSSTPS